MKYLLCGALLFISFNLTASHPPDSLLKLAVKAKTTEQKVQLFCDAAVWWRDKNEFDSAMLILNQALNVAQSLRDTAALAQVYFHMGGVNWRRGRHEEARFYYHRCIELRRESGDKAGMAAAYMNLALVQRDIGSFDASLRTLRLAEQLYLSVNDSTKLANLYSLSGGVYLRINHYDSAVFFFRRALQLRTHQNDQSGIAGSYLNMATLYRAQNQFDSSVYYFHKALDIQKSIGEINNLAFTYLNLGGLFWDNKNYKTALDNYLSSLELYEQLGDKLRIATVLENIGLIYRDIGNIERALTYHFQVLKIYQNLGNLYRESIAYNFIAGNYLTANKYDSALHFYYKALSIRKTIGSAQMIASTYNSLGQVYKNRNQPDSSLFYYMKAASIYIELGDRKNLAATYNNLANLKKFTTQYDSAAFYFTKAAQIRKAIGDKLGLGYTSLQFGELLLNRGRSLEAFTLLNKAFEIGKELSVSDLKKEAASLLSQYFEKVGNCLEALNYYKIFHEIETTLNKDETIKYIADMEIRFENERKVRLLERKQFEIELMDSQLRGKNLRLYLLLGALFLTISLVVIVTIAWKQKAETNKILTQQKKEIEQQRDQIRLQNEKITDSIVYASRIQNAMLPPLEQINQIFPNSFVFFKPRDVVSGDFYWVFRESHYSVLAVSDCTGHGVPGAFMSMLGISLLNQLYGKFSTFDPASILGELRHKIKTNLHQMDYTETNTDGMDMGLVIIDTRTNQAAFSGGNIPLWLWQNNQKELRVFNPDRMPVGVFVGQEEPFTNHFFRISKGDMFYLFSDGYLDQFGGPKNRKLMQSGFTQILRQCFGADPEKQQQILEQELNRWQGDNRQIDDILIVGVLWD